MVLDRAEGDQPVQSVLEIRHDRVMIQKWDLSCGAAALATLLRYQFGEPVTEEEIARALMGRAEYRRASRARPGPRGIFLPRS